MNTFKEKCRDSPLHSEEELSAKLREEAEDLLKVADL
jgi:hypothetical protein